MHLFETLSDLPPLPNSERQIISTGWNGTAQTIYAMRRCVSHGKRDPIVAQLVGRIIRNVPSKDWTGYARAIFEWIRDNIKYVYDPNGVEKICTPRVILQNGMGDCDDMCVLSCAMLETIGLPCRFVTIKANPKSNEFSHVYSQVKIPGQPWMSLDCTMAHPMGWEAPGNFTRQTWPSSLDAVESHGGDSLNGLSATSNSWIPFAAAAALFLLWSAKK